MEMEYSILFISLLFFYYNIDTEKDTDFLNVVKMYLTSFTVLAIFKCTIELP